MTTAYVYRLLTARYYGDHNDHIFAYILKDGDFNVPVII